MPIVRFDPARDFATLQGQIQRLFGDVYLRDDNVSNRGTWTPPVDIYETDAHDLVVKVELPDMTREDIEVTVEQNTLTLKGEKKLHAGVNEDRYRRVERSYGQFSRSFSLPSTVDAGKVSAEYKNGVLTVTLPFREESKPRTINVEVAA